MVSRGTRASRGRGGGSRRKLVWARQVNTGAAIAVGEDATFNADLLAPFRTQLGARSPGSTVMRVRGSMILVETSGQSRMVLAGIRKFTQSPEDMASDLLAVDGPADDPHADWLMFETLHANVNDALPIYFDVKAMRRLDEVSDGLVLSFQAPDALAAQLRYSISVLLALP